MTALPARPAGASWSRRSSKALARPPEELPPLEITEPLPPSAVAIADLLRVLLKAVAARHDVAAKLIATTDELDKIALDDDADVAALHGLAARAVRRGRAGDQGGKFAIAVEHGKIVTLPRLAKEADGQNGQQPQRRREGTKGKAETKSFEDQSHQQTAKP